MRLVILTLVIVLTAAGCRIQSSKERFVIYKRDADQALRTGDRTAAEHSLELALHESEQASLPLETPECLLKLGTLYVQDARFADAQTSLERALTLYESLMKKADYSTRLLLENRCFATKLQLAELYSRSGKSQQAETTFTQLLQECKSNSHISADLRQETLRGYAGLLNRLGKQNEAGRAAGELKILNLSEDWSQPFYAAHTQFCQGNFSQSLRLAESSFEIAQRHNDGEHASQVEQLMALCHLMQGDYTQAETQLRHSISVGEDTCPDKQAILGRMTSLAFCLEKEGRANEADALLRKVGATNKEHLIERTESIGLILLPLVAQKNNKALIDFFKWKYKKLEMLGGRHMDKFGTEEEIARFSLAADQRSEAETYCARALAEAEMTNDRSARYTHLLLATAVNLDGLGKTADADKVWRKWLSAIDLSEYAQSAECPAYLSIRADQLFSQKRYAECDRFATKGVSHGGTDNSKCFLLHAAILDFDGNRKQADRAWDDFIQVARKLKADHPTRQALPQVLSSLENELREKKETARAQALASRKVDVCRRLL